MNTKSTTIFPNGTIIDTPKELGLIIRATRKRMGLRQAETAALCNVGVRFLSELENGKPTVSLSKVISILKGLGLFIVIQSKSTRV
ncbi:MAG: helix-turn-helix domain-containing protein [Candidatus Margulisiibacteriota bacterium]